MVLHWNRREFGCSYQKQGVWRVGFTDESMVVDIFVMRKIVNERPIAISVGRFQNGQPLRQNGGHCRSNASVAVSEVQGLLAIDARLIRDALALTQQPPRR